MNLYRKLVLVLTLCVGLSTQAQQDPHFTQYMYNTMTVNPAYAGSQGHSVITALARTQWVGFEGAPDTQTLSFDTPLNWKGVGLGVNLMNDKLGPTNEIYGDLNLTYTIETSLEGRLAFGLKGGVRHFNLKRELLSTQTNDVGAVTDPSLKGGVDWFPTVGAGLYYYTGKGYIGLSVPNFLSTEHYDENTSTIKAKERYHFFGIAGYVFRLSESTKFKPATLVKSVSGAPLSVDLSANFLFNDKFHAGLAYRWNDAYSLLLGFNVNENLHIGYAYDLTTQNYRPTNSGSHELMLKYHFLSPDVVISPRFF